jgi:hypothetical protein
MATARYVSLNCFSPASRRAPLEYFLDRDVAHDQAGFAGVPEVIRRLGYHLHHTFTRREL